MSEYLIVERPPSLVEYQALRRAIMLPEIRAERMRTALMHSQYAVCVVFQNRVIGCGRVIGDGGIYYYVQDVLVSPEFQSEGIDEIIMDRLMEYLRANVPDNAVVGMVAVDGFVSLYERYGFRESYGGGYLLGGFEDSGEDPTESLRPV